MSDASGSRVITEPLGGSPLSLAIQTQRLPAELQPWWPSGVDEWREHATRARAEGAWYDRIEGAIAPRGAAKERLERTVAEHGVIVTTGQQAGLFGGPLYTLAKALTALGLADALERDLGIPVAPVFWAATDDADFAEASSTYVADADGLHELTVASRPAAGTPMSAAPLGDTTALLDALRKSCGSAAHAVYFEIARSAFTQHRTIGDAYVRLLRDLLEPLGVSVLDSSSATYQDAARPVLVQALKRASAIADAVSERTSAIRRLGFTPQVDDDRGLSLVFAIVSGIKRRLTLAEAATFAKRVARDVALTPNVLLRPLVEREVLPTIAYVAGPGELAYAAQSNAAAAALDRDGVVVVPRWSATILEPFARRALKRLGIEYHEVRDLSAVERRLAAASLPASVAAAWGKLEEQVRRSVRELGDAVSRESLMPPSVVEGLERSLGHKLGRAERRLLAAMKRRDERVRRDLMVVSGAMFPRGERQERVLNFIPMLARGGDDLMREMRGAATSHAHALVRGARTEPVAAR